MDERPYRLALHLRVAVLEHRRQASASASWPPNIRSRSIAVRRAAGFGDSFNCSTVSRPARPNPNSRSRSRRIARGIVLGGQRVGQRRDDPRTDGLAQPRNRLDAVVVNFPELGDEIPGQPARGELLSRGFGRTSQELPPARTRLTRDCGCCLLGRLKVAAEHSALDFANATIPAISAHHDLVVFDLEQVEQQLKVELLDGGVGNGLKPCVDAFRRVVRDALDVYGLLARTRQFARVIGRDIALVRVRASISVADCHSSSKLASRPNGVRDASSFARSRSRSL